jgi:hypothetical protein
MSLKNLKKKNESTDIFEKIVREIVRELVRGALAATDRV